MSKMSIPDDMEFVTHSKESLIENIQKSELTMPDHGIINTVRTSMTMKLESLPSFNSKCCIYTVPEYIRKEKRECYQPLVISIGPVFYNDPELKTLQDLKWTFLKLFLEHPSNAHQSLDPYLNCVKEREAEIRACYQLDLSILSDVELMEMIVLDASFLIYLFMFVDGQSYAYFRRLGIDEEPMLGLVFWLGRDLFLEENQLPFFVLTDIYNIAFSAVCPSHSFVDLALVYISKLVSGIPGRDAMESIIGGNKIRPHQSSIKHLVDLRRMCCCLSFYDQQKQEKERVFHKFPSATQLIDAGVKFKLNGSVNFLEITFDKRDGVLKIPGLTFYDFTEPSIRSILFFERCNCYDRYFTDYIFFLNRLINTVEDIQVLQHSGILDNVLGSDEDAVELFSNLTKYLSYSYGNFTFSEVSEDLLVYVSTRWNIWRAKYFSHPWSIMSVIYAIIVFILTVLQTVAGFIFK